MRRILASAAVLVAVGAFLALTLGSSGGSSGNTYKIELQNAFGLVGGEQFKVAGVPVGKVQGIDLCKFTPGSHCQNPLDAVITVSANTRGFNQFRSSAFCQSRPQSLIGEYFLDCDPGTTGKVLKPGSTIPVSNTQSTIPVDLVQNIMQLPYRQRFSLIINELGAAVAARSMDIQSALRRADPALAETDNLLALLANDANTIKALNVSADHVITALAVNKGQVLRFIDEANRAAQIAGGPQANPASCGTPAAAHCIEATWNKLPGFLAQLRPTLAKLGAASDAQIPVLNNLNAAAGNLETFFKNLVPFSNSSRVSIACGENGQPACPGNGASLGTVSRTGIPAVRAATPTVAALQRFTGPTGCDQQSKQILNCMPELAQNLAIVLQWLDSRSHAVEPDPRSPSGGVGFTGLEGVLQYAFNITNAINTFTPWGHELAVDALFSTACSPYATPQTIANNLATYTGGGGNLNSFNPNNPRSCYAWLGPNQQGVNQSDPSWSPQTRTPANPSPCVPDPGGYPVQGFGTHYFGPKTNACKLAPGLGITPGGSPITGLPPIPGAPSLPGVPPAPTLPPLPTVPGLPSLSRSGSASHATTAASGFSNPLSGAFGQVISQVTGAPANANTQSTGATSGPSTGGSNGASGGAGGTSPAQAQQLLNYLLAP